MSISSYEAVEKLLGEIRGERPYSLRSIENEQTLNMVLALVVELIASNDRIDNLEREIAKLKGAELSELRRVETDESVLASRREHATGVIARILRVLIDSSPVVAHATHLQKGAG